MSIRGTKEKLDTSADNVVRLRVAANSPLAEVSVFSGSFALMGTSVGSLDIPVTPGVYKIRYRAGPAVVDQLISIDPDGQGRELTGPPVLFPSPAPVSGTSTYHSRHAEAAVRINNNFRQSRGAGSALLLFVRSVLRQSDPLFASRVSLHNSSGDTLAERADFVLDDVEGEWIGLSTDIDPGCYILRTSDRKGRYHETAIHTSGGWETQVFLSAPDGQQDIIDLGDVAVFMSRLEKGFDPHRKELAWTELARLMLSDLPESGVEKIADVGHQAVRSDPMLGIYISYVLRAAGLEPSVTSMLRRLEEVVPSLPDVRALSLQSLTTGQQPRPFETPPMLDKSWDAVIRASYSFPRLVSPVSLSGRVSERTIPNDIRLIWGGPSTDPIAQNRLRRLGLARIDLEALLKSIVSRFPLTARLDLVDSLAEREAATRQIQQISKQLALDCTEVSLLQYAFWFMEATLRLSGRELVKRGLHSPEGVRRHLILSFRLPNSILVARLQSLRRKVSAFV